MACTDVTGFGSLGIQNHVLDGGLIDSPYAWNSMDIFAGESSHFFGLNEYDSCGF